jgi:hypothetical protein
LRICGPVSGSLPALLTNLGIPSGTVRCRARAADLR